VGVDVFFVLSGFLITTLLIQEHDRNGNVSLRAFYARRAWRLLPALGCVIVAVGLVSLVLSPDERSHNVTGVVAAATYSSDWLLALRGNGSLGVLGHTWSLAVEEQFYLVWPLLLVPVLRMGGPWAVAIVAGVCALVVLLARTIVMADGVPFDRIYYAADLHADPVMLGCCLAGLRCAGVHLARRTADAAGLMGMGALVLLIAAPGVVAPAPFGLTVGAVAGAALIMACLDGTAVGLLLAWRPLAATGLVSYALYLWSPLVAVGASWLGVPAGPVYLAFVLLGSLGIAAASWRLLERPIAIRRRRAAAARLTASPVT
jgi:peptidoglycan/LPS O-acetylase OafA/YrhL